MTSRMNANFIVMYCCIVIENNKATQIYLACLSLSHP
jgi:hypothetical protein